jgi:hypothetical protein
VIPQRVQYIDPSAFCQILLKSILIHSDNIFFRIVDHFIVDIVGKRLILGFDILSRVVIPGFIRILDRKCFFECFSLSSISFKVSSSLHRIEEDAFGFSSLKSIVIPRSVRFIHGSAFDSTPLTSMSIERGSKFFRVNNHFLIDILHAKLIHAFDIRSTVIIPKFVKIIGSFCFSACSLLSSISFESPSSLKRIESYAFQSSSLRSIAIPRTVQYIDSSAFLFTPLSSIEFHIYRSWQ